MKAVFYSILLIVLLTVIGTAATLRLLDSSRDLNSCIADRGLTERHLRATQIALDAANGQLQDLMRRYDGDIKQREEEIRALKDQLRATREDIAQLMLQLARADSERKDARRRQQSLLAQLKAEQNTASPPAADTSPVGEPPAARPGTPTAAPYLLAAAGPMVLTLFGLAHRLINRRSAAKTPTPPITEDDGTISVRMSRQHLADYIRWRRQHDRD